MEVIREAPGNDPAPQDPPSPSKPIKAVGEAARGPEKALRPLYEANQHCIELLVKAAWSDRSDLPLVRQFRASFRSMSAEARVRAAQKAFLLVDIEFTNSAWWKLLKDHPLRTSSPPRSDFFPRSSAIQLARASLTLVWHSVQSNGAETCLLGVHPSVAEVIGAFSMSEIERTAERRSRHVRPRWEDRPAVWQELIQAAGSPDIRRAREFSLRALRLLAGELLEIR